MRAAPTGEMAACLAAIRKLTVDGVPPTYDQLKVELGLGSKSGVHSLLKRMRERGLVEWMDGHARSLRIAWQADEVKTMSSAELRSLSQACQAELTSRGLS